jgi:hypothetical protein
MDGKLQFKGYYSNPIWQRGETYKVYIGNYAYSQMHKPSNAYEFEVVYNFASGYNPNITILSRNYFGRYYNYSTECGSQVSLSGVHFGLGSLKGSYIGNDLLYHLYL